MPRARCASRTAWANPATTGIIVSVSEIAIATASASTPSRRSGRSMRCSTASRSPIRVVIVRSAASRSSDATLVVLIHAVSGDTRIHSADPSSSTTQRSRHISPIRSFTGSPATRYSVHTTTSETVTLHPSCGYADDTSARAAKIASLGAARIRWTMLAPGRYDWIIGTARGTRRPRPPVRRLRSANLHRRAPHGRISLQDRGRG